MLGRWRICAMVGLILASASLSAPTWAIQCAPYARSVSGLDLYGAAWKWWDEADGQYDRGRHPALGAAVVFKRVRGMPSGHVAIVTRIVNTRTIMVEHANWSPVHGRKGRVEKNAKVIDVSPKNDWSEVRVWYGPVHGVGNKVYPVYGFIYR